MGDCGCVVADDYDGPEFYSETMRKARKEHRCTECRRIIEHGEHYEYVTGKWDGEFSEHKTCPDCLSIRKAFFCKGWGHGAIYEDLWDHIYYMDGSVSSDCIVPLTATARECVCAMIEEAWTRLDEREAQLEKMRARKTTGIHG